MVIDVFISYAREDKPFAMLIAQALEREGLSVWWDRNVPPGKSYDRVIGEALDSAKCIVVLWSKQSVGSDWVKDEAEEGNRRGVLVPTSIEEVRVPLGFRRLQTANLVGWKGDDNHPEFQDVVSAVKSHLSKQREEALARTPTTEDGAETERPQRQVKEIVLPTQIGPAERLETEQRGKERLDADLLNCSEGTSRLRPHSRNQRLRASRKPPSHLGTVLTKEMTTTKRSATTPRRFG